MASGSSARVRSGSTCCRPSSSSTSSTATRAPGTTRFMTSRTFSLTKPVRAMRVQRSRLRRAIRGTVIRGEAMEMNSTRVAAARGMLAQQINGHLHMREAQKGHRQARQPVAYGEHVADGRGHQQRQDAADLRVQACKHPHQGFGLAGHLRQRDRMRNRAETSRQGTSQSRPSRMAAWSWRRPAWPGAVSGTVARPESRPVTSCCPWLPPFSSRQKSGAPVRSTSYNAGRKGLLRPPESRISPCCAPRPRCR